MDRIETKLKLRLCASCAAPALIALITACGLNARPVQLGVPDSGTLAIVDHDGKDSGICPLHHTSVVANISGPVGRVTVTQEFHNPETRRIEAVYTFPLPPNSAVDGMTIRVGEKQIRGIVKPRDEAAQIYERARRRGSLAGMLAQERPNIFTQSLANIGPNETLRIEITYVEMIPFEEGTFEFRFPMVVGPRYIPGNFTPEHGPTLWPTVDKINPPPIYDQLGGGWSSNTDQVPDASRITPSVTPPGTRAGHDISLILTLDAGVPLTGLHCTTHKVSVERNNDHQAIVKLTDAATLPNKDFVLTYDVLGKTMGDAVLAHTDKRGKFLTLLLTPPERPAAKDITPKELVFVLDTSGSMSGFPIQKAKEAMRASLAGLNPQDTFNLITFSGDTSILFPEPVPATPRNLQIADTLLNGVYGGGGTEMMSAIRAALDPSDALDHIRVVCFMTDGFVGNDMEILSEIRKHQNARVFAFGIGSSVNHYLLDRMAAYGRGEVQYVGLQDDGAAAAQRFTERVRNPVLTDIHIDWGDLGASGISPVALPDLFGAKLVVITARYSHPGRHIIRLRGNQGGRLFSREIAVNLPADQPAQSELATLWARKTVEMIMAGDLSAIQRGTPTREVRDAIERLGLEYNLVTQFTSFIAVEERVVNDGGQAKRIDVPVEMPEGVSYRGVFGESPSQEAEVAGTRLAANHMATPIYGGFQAGQVASPMIAKLSAPVSLLALKLDRTLLNIVQKTQAGQPLNTAEAALIHDGLVSVEIQLSAAVGQEQLTALGFRRVSSDGLFKMKGTVAIKDLPRLTALTVLLFVSPA